MQTTDTPASGKCCPLCKCCPCKCIKMLVPVLIGFAYIFAYEYVLHGILLKPQYEATAHLWRTPADMQGKYPELLGFQFLITAVLFAIYKKGFSKTLCGGVCFGTKLGLLCGLGMAYSYVWTPIPYTLALAWFAGNFIKVLGLGVIWGAMAQHCCKAGSCTTGACPCGKAGCDCGKNGGSCCGPKTECCGSGEKSGGGCCG